MNTDREDPPLLGSERATLVSFPDWHRATLALKCEGLSDDQLRAELLHRLRYAARRDRAFSERRRGVPPV